MQLPLRARRPGPRLAHVLVAAVVALAALLVATPAVVPHAHAEGAGSIDPYPPLHDRLSAGLHHACLVLDSGGVTCWGDGDQGALGYGNTNDIGDNETPAANPVNGGLVALPSGLAAVAVAAGNRTTCALLVNGQVSCWGDGARGALGYGNTNDIGDNETPAANPVSGGFVPLPGGLTAIDIAAGNQFNCALLVDHSVTCWGSGASGELGYGNTNDIGDNETPAANPVNGGRVPLPGGVAVSRLSAGGGSVCVVTTDGRVACWGYNADGRLGYGNTTTVGDNETPAANAVNGGFVKVTSAAGVTAVAVSVGSSSACAVLSTGGLTCWGDGTNGVLGFGNLNKIGDNEAPADNPVNGGLVPLPAGPGGAAGSSRVRAVDVGLSQTCAWLSTSEISCWGAGAVGQLGYGNTTTIGDNETPAQNNVHYGVVPLNAPPSAVATGGFFTCALVSGSPVCWGASPAGQLGYGNTATIGDDESPADNPVNAGVVPLPGGGLVQQSLVPVTPARVMDTRAGFTTIDGEAAGTGAIEPGTIRALKVNGRGGVPTAARSVTLNVAVTNATAPGFVTVFPCSADVPNAANLNYGVGDTIANSVTVKSSSSVCFSVYSTVDVVVDVTEFAASGSNLETVVPARLLDTRPGYTTIDGQQQGAGPLAGGQEIALPVLGRGGVSANASAVLLNIAVDHPSSAGFITAYPCGSPRPLAANLNYAADQTIPNAVLVKVGIGGTVCLYTMSTTHLVADVDGYVTAGSAFVQAVQPARLLDTRPGFTTVDGLHQATGAVAADGTATLVVTGRGGVPQLARSVVINLTATGSTAPGFVTAFPCGEPRPLAAGLNYAAGQTIANSVTVKVGAGGAICLYAYSATDLVVDVDGFTL